MAMHSTLPSIVAWNPDNIGVSWVLETAAKLDWASRRLPEMLPHVLPAKVACSILEAATELLKTEPTLLEVHPPSDGNVTVVGDLHGHFHDFIEMLRHSGDPSEKDWYIFNGDYVDRGIWGIELLVTLAAWKLALPRCVYLLRGDHESASCTLYYGFKMELKAKYGDSYKEVYRAAKLLFRQLPLGARVENATLVVHGGMWRSPYDVQADEDPKSTRLLQPGDLQDLRDATKGGMDPIGIGASLVAADTLWSDPTHLNGMRNNLERGLGTHYGPDVAARFLRDNKLKLLIRSHESPDSRIMRKKEGKVSLGVGSDGWWVDHESPDGKMMTVFSAPDYPMFATNSNRASVLKLYPPSFCDPQPLTYTSVERPTDRELPFMSPEGVEIYDSDADLYEAVEHNDMKLYRDSALARQSKRRSTDYARTSAQRANSRTSLQPLSMSRASSGALSTVSEHRPTKDELPLLKSTRKESKGFLQSACWCCCPE